ncbi:MAG TPA: ribosome silencing factor [Pyrinomonadaceae bacterium]|nr:ribosome silencing factor [Pyrinomonadaceae bacterium]
MNENSRTRRTPSIEQDSQESRGEETTGAGAADAEEVRPATFEDLDERLRGALRAASDKKALESVVLDLRRVASFTDFFVITSATNVRQVQAIADEVVERLKEQGGRALRVEGYNAAEWVLIDYGDFIVHVFEDEARRFYDLERLWRDASRVELPGELRGASRETETESRSSLRRER